MFRTGGKPLSDGQVLRPLDRSFWDAEAYKHLVAR